MLFDAVHNLSLCPDVNALSVSRSVSSSEFGDLESLCKTVVKEKQPFERLEISKETLLKMFKVSSIMMDTHRLLCLV